MDINDEFIVIPNAGKEFLKNLINILTLVLIIIGLLIFLQAQIGEGTFTEILEAFEVEVNTGLITLLLSLLFILGAAIVLIFNYINIRNQKYTIHNDKIEYVGSKAFLFLQKETIPFNNITRITFTNKGTLNKLLNCGEIKIELTGLKIPSIILESIDEPDRLTELIQQKVNQYNMQKQMQFQEQRKIEDIMKKF